VAYDRVATHRLIPFPLCPSDSLVQNDPLARGYILWYGNDATLAQAHLRMAKEMQSEIRDKILSVLDPWNDLPPNRVIVLTAIPSHPTAGASAPPGISVQFGRVAPPPSSSGAMFIPKFVTPALASVQSLVLHSSIFVRVKAFEPHPATGEPNFDEPRMLHITISEDGSLFDLYECIARAWTGATVAGAVAPLPQRLRFCVQRRAASATGAAASWCNSADVAMTRPPLARTTTDLPTLTSTPAPQPLSLDAAPIASNDAANEQQLRRTCIQSRGIMHGAVLCLEQADRGRKKGKDTPSSRPPGRTTEPVSVIPTGVDKRHKFGFGPLPSDSPAGMGSLPRPARNAVSPGSRVVAPKPADCSQRPLSSSSSASFSCCPAERVALSRESTHPEYVSMAGESVSRSVTHSPPQSYASTSNRGGRQMQREHTESERQLTSSQLPALKPQIPASEKAADANTSNLFAPHLHNNPLLAARRVRGDSAATQIAGGCEGTSSS
jgi:hypothetical protein